MADGRREQRSRLATQYFSWRKFWDEVRVEFQVRFAPSCYLTDKT
jgi:hypothetical protein